MPAHSVAAFIELISRLGLLERPQLDELTHVLAEKYPDLQSLARELWQRAWFTRYQIEEVLQGRGQELILGQYILLEPIGEGGMGQVFKARQVRLNRLVAL